MEYSLEGCEVEEAGGTQDFMTPVHLLQLLLRAEGRCSDGLSSLCCGGEPLYEVL